MAEIRKQADAAPMVPPQAGTSSYDETLEQHRAIRRAVQDLTDLLGKYRVGMDAGTWRVWMASFSGRLFGLRERLLRHFHEEEASGLYEALSERFPSVALRTLVVRDEHKTILDELQGLLASLRVLQPTFPLEPKLLDRAREVLYQVVCHERRESDLIARAYLEDLGQRD
jgi:hypothetical protein